MRFLIHSSVDFRSVLKYFPRNLFLPWVVATAVSGINKLFENLSNNCYLLADAPRNSPNDEPVATPYTVRNSEETSRETSAPPHYESHRKAY